MAQNNASATGGGLRQAQDLVAGLQSAASTSSKDGSSLRHSVSLSAAPPAGAPGTKRRNTATKKLVTREGATGAEMDQERLDLKTYDYLCRIGEAKQWIEACIGEDIEAIELLEESLRNGIALAKLARFLDPASLKNKRIYEDTSKLHFKHIDNMNFFYNATQTVGLPSIFMFETSDLYDKKNIPKVIYCVHALSHLCDKKGIGPKMQNLVGKLQFTNEQIEKTNQSLAEQGIQLPEFSDIGKALAKELNEDTDEQRRERFLADNEEHIVRAQAQVRGYLARRAFRRDQGRVIKSQAQVRMHQQRSAYLARLRYLQAHSAEARRIQAVARGWLARRAYHDKLRRFRENSEAITRLQAMWRAKRQRDAFRDRQRYLRDQVSAIAKIQRSFRAHSQHAAYDRLLHLRNIDVRTLQRFSDLMDDSQLDFDEELEIERLRNLVVSKIRENNALEGEVNELDVKIALLVSNRMTLEEIVHTTTKQAKKAEARRESARQAFSLKALNKENREKLLHYQELFYLLQTEPKYLARLMFALSSKSAINLQKAVENVVIALFAYAQNPREEYLFLRLINQSIDIEVDNASSVASITTGNPLFIKLVLQYTRGVKDQQYLRELLGPHIKALISGQSNAANLDTDPVSIYKRLIQEQELKTGQRSTRKYDVTAKEAFQDPEVAQTYEQNVQQLIGIAEALMQDLAASTSRMPYGIRAIAKELRGALLKKFPQQRDEVQKAVGHLLYYRYMNPCIVSPDLFDVVEGSISPQQRKNLAEVSKLLNHISSGRTTFLDEDVRGLAADTLGQYANRASQQFNQFIREAATVETPEEHFDVDEFRDLARRSKPTIVINLGEIATVHRALLDNLVEVAEDELDNMRTILQDLGDVPEFPEDDRTRSAEIVLTLVNRFAKLRDAELETKEAFLTAKKLVTALVKLTTGRNLVAILEGPTAQKEELAYQQLIEADRGNFNLQQKKLLERQIQQQQQNSTAAGDQSVTGSQVALNRQDSSRQSDGPTPRSPSTTYSNRMTLSPVAASYQQWPQTLAALKRQALELLVVLEAKDLVRSANYYADILTAIAKDILSRNKRREQRKHERASLERTLDKLADKNRFLEDQKQSYNDYVRTCMQNLTKGGAKKQAKPLPFTKHWAHYVATQKAEAQPKFGSFKYTAADLYRKGVLVSIDGYSPKQYGHITLAISSNEPGVFNIDISVLGIAMPYRPEIHLEDLLQSQFAGTTVVALFDGAKVNVNLLIYLLNKKFYA